MNLFKILIPMALLGVMPASADSTTHMNHSGHTEHMKHGQMAAPLPTEGGQGGFTAIAEIVAMLRADPNTDWSKVDISALREHLVDMNELTLNAVAETKIRDGEIVFSVTGKGRTLRAVRMMVPAHAGVLRKEDHFQAEGEATDTGAVMRIAYADESEKQEILALGFFGIMATGAHHQEHHMMMATGQGHPH